MYDQSENGYTHMACLLGYANQFGEMGDRLLRTAALSTGFAPLIVGLFRMTDNLSVHGRHVVAMTASLFCLYSHLILAEPGKVFDYVLRCSCFVVHGLDKDSEERVLPIQKLKQDATATDGLRVYLRDTKQDQEVAFWRADVGDAFPLKRLERPADGLSIENAFNQMVSFKPVAPLSLRSIVGTTITHGTKGNTLLFTSISLSKGHEYANSVDIYDPRTGKCTSRDVEELALECGAAGQDRSAALIDKDKVMQIVQVCFDESSSMAANLGGRLPGKGVPGTVTLDEFARVTLARQYLTIFANRTYAFRVPCVQGLISFNTSATVRAPLSPLVPDFEDGIKKVTPGGRTHLWDALDKACDDVIAFAMDAAGKKKYPNAKNRVLVISDGDDVGSAQQPWVVAERLCKNFIVVDAVIVSSDDACGMLVALCHMTQGLAFRPGSIDEGLALFEQEAFLQLDMRKPAPRYRGKFDEATMTDMAGKATFDRSAVNKVIQTATANVPLAVPKYVIYMNRNVQIPSPRMRRILRELHYAASVQDEHARGLDEDGNPVSVYDSEIRVYPFRGNLDQWRVYVKGCEGTPYEGKWWYMYVTFPPTYPVSPPVFRFISRPYHLNVSEEGRICLNMIERGYMTTSVVVEMIQRIRSLFLMPDIDTPIQLAKLDLFKSNRAEYDRRARESTELYGMNSPEEWLAGLTIESDVPADFGIEVGTVIPDYLKSQISGKYIPREQRVTGPGGMVYDRAELQLLRNGAGTDPCTGLRLGVDDMDEFYDTH